MKYGFIVVEIYVSVTLRFIVKSCFFLDISALDHLIIENVEQEDEEEIMEEDSQIIDSDESRSGNDSAHLETSIRQ